MDVDAEGRLVVRTDAGEQHVFTGEVSVHGIYGQYNYKKGQMHNRASAPFIFDDLECAPQAMTEGVLA